MKASVYLKGEHNDLAAGDKLTISGILLGIHHNEATVNGVTVPEWTEIRVEQTPVWLGQPRLAPPGGL